MVFIIIKEYLKLNINLIQIVTSLYYEELTNPELYKKLLEKINFNKIENIDLNYFKNSNKQEIN